MTWEVDEEQLFYLPCFIHFLFKEEKEIVHFSFYKRCRKHYKYFGLYIPCTPRTGSWCISPASNASKYLGIWIEADKATVAVHTFLFSLLVT